MLAPTLDELGELDPLPGDVRVHLDAGYDSQATRADVAARGMSGTIAHKGETAPVQAGRHNAFARLQRRYKRRQNMIDAYFDLADAIITVRGLIRRG